MAQVLDPLFEMLGSLQPTEEEFQAAAGRGDPLLGPPPPATARGPCKKESLTKKALLIAVGRR